MTDRKYDTGTIRQTYQRLQEEGMNVSENSLRTWVRNGTLPAAYCGRKAYIYYPNVIKLLTEGCPCTPQQEPVGTPKIRALG